jgi:hypothetical protein
MDGPLLLQEDVATGLVYEDDGAVYTTDNPGLGITFTDLYSN